MALFSERNIETNFADMILQPSRFSRRWARRILRFRRAQSGATAIEFAIIAPLFIGLLISVLETGIYFFAQNVLQNAAVQSGRVFMTGQGQTNGTTQVQFVTNTVCPLIQALFTCNNLMVDVETYTTFGGANVAKPTLTYNAQGAVTNSWVFSPGTTGITVVRLIYQWPVITGPFSLIGSQANGTAEIMGVSAFKVEPYQ